MRKSWLAGVVLAAAALTAAMPALAETKLKLTHALSDSSHYGTGAKALAQSLESTSNGKFRVKHFANDTLGGERKVIEGLQAGTIDLAIVSTSAVLDFVPEISVFDIPFLMRYLQHASDVLDGPIGRDMLIKFPSQDLVALAWGEQGFRHLTNNVCPVTTPADVKGLKIRTPQHSIHSEAFRRMGILPAPMPLPDAIVALQQGTIDGQENPPSVIISAKLSSTQKYLALTGHVYVTAMILGIRQAL